MFKVKDVMSTDVVSVSTDATIEEVIALLLENEVSGLPVVDPSGRVAGVVTEIDLLRLLYDPAPDHEGIGEYVSHEVVTVHEEQPLIEVADVFVKLPYRRLPVIREGRLAGVIARRDLIRFIRDTRARVAGHAATPTTGA